MSGPLKAFYADLHQLGTRLRETASEFQRLVRAGRFPEHGGSFRFDRDDPADPLNRAVDITRDHEFLVAVTGAFSSGKSTVLNVLLDAPDLLPASAIPLTAVCTVIRRGEGNRRIRVRHVPFEECFERVTQFLGGRLRKPFARPEHIDEALERPESFADGKDTRESLRRFARLLSRHDAIAGRPATFEERYRFICGGGTVATSGDGGARMRHFLPTPTQEQEYLASGGSPDEWVTQEWLALIRDVTLWIDSPLLENDIAFLDLPGLNCREDYHRRAIQSYCNMVDCVILTAFQPGNQADEDVVANFRALSSNFRDKLFFVFNRVDQFESEPQELARSFDYLTRDCIGRDFPRDRCFLTSAFLARGHLVGRAGASEALERFRGALAGLDGGVGGLDRLLERVLEPDDPGGMGHLRRCLQRFLTDDAHPAKIDEILRAYRGVADGLRAAATPRIEEVRRMDRGEMRVSAVLGYFTEIERMARHAIYRFRYEYLRESDDAASDMTRDLRSVLERAHRDLHERIVAYFNRPIRTSPPREDPVSEFDLRRIGDDASHELRREFQELIVSAVVDRVRARFHERLAESGFREHFDNLLGGSPEWVARLDGTLERFELRLHHSMLSKVRERFHRMPGGRRLKRLERSVPLAEMKSHLIRIFSEFYPDWIYQNVSTRIQENLWLAFFLDAEELEHELDRLFDDCQGALTTPAVVERARIPEELEGALGELHEVARVCREIDVVDRELTGLATRAGGSAERPTGEKRPAVAS